MTCRNYVGLLEHQSRCFYLQTLWGQLKKWQGRKIPSHPFPGQKRIHLWVFFEKKVWCKKNAGISGWFLGVQNFASDPTAVTLGLPQLRWAYWPDQSPTSAMRPRETEPGETIWDPGQVDPPIHPGGAEMEKHAPLPPSWDLKPLCLPLLGNRDEAESSIF